MRLLIICITISLTEAYRTEYVPVEDGNDQLLRIRSGNQDLRIQGSLLRIQILAVAKIKIQIQVGKILSCGSGPICNVPVPLLVLFQIFQLARMRIRIPGRYAYFEAIPDTSNRRECESGFLADMHILMLFQIHQTGENADPDSWPICIF